jgi:GNAT superfamily N-acetyltransferase
MEIIYKEIDDALIEKLIAHFKKENLIRNNIHREDGSYSIAALCGDIPVGFISTYTESFTPPIGDRKDAYIDIIEVDEQYRRCGIARTMVRLSEEWAAKQGFTQIRAWSSEDKIEAIPMWENLGYCMCPAKIWVEWCEQIVDGYYVVKKLNQ